MEKNNNKLIDEVNQNKEKDKLSIQYISNQSHLVTNPLIYNYYYSQYSNSSLSNIKTNYYYNNIIFKTHQSLLFSPKENASCRFFIIKSFNEDNIHKVKRLLIIQSIKYRIWCSTVKGNKILQNAYTEAKNQYPILLFFSVNGSGRFVGVAQMISDLQYNTNFMLWDKKEEWKGFFFVMWIFIKDIPNKILKNITNELNEGKSVVESRNVEEINYASGMKMMKIFKDYKNDTSIIDDFDYYEYKQNNSNKQQSLNNCIIENDKKFFIFISIYKRINIIIFII